MDVTWAIFKQFITDRELSIQYVDLGDGYWMCGIQGQFKLFCLIPKDGGAECLDFEDNFKPAGNQPLIARTQTQREVKNLRLQCVAIQGYAAAETGVCVATIEIPATGESSGRVIDWGEAWMTGTSHEDDRITGIYVDAPIGEGGAWVQVSSYTDEDSADAGWWIPQRPAVADVEPLGYYGDLPGGCRIRIEARCGGDATAWTGRALKLNLGWGKYDAV